ncbi:Rha family transcriptional regulator [Paenibacillus sp. FSL R5-0701]|uniref:Rha family transcriptional regulator n=1 Tax=Paenibacillus sp. FSL R5-0701 TaxID=2921654 RepID=UPI0030CCD718
MSTKLILNPDCMLYEMKGKALYSSRQVAEEFDKRHDTILRSIDEITHHKIVVSGAELTERKNALSDETVQLLAGQNIEEFFKENFFEDKYKDASGKKNRQVLMTRKGSMLIVMGFSGRKATAIKIGLLNRFEAMEEFIFSLNSARMEYPALTEAIYNAREEPKPHHFINEADMINRIVLGMSAKSFREEHGIKKGESIRPYLTTEQIRNIETLQRVDIGLIVGGIEFQERKVVLSNYINRLSLKKAA